MKSMHFLKSQMGTNGLRLDASFHLSDGASTRRALARMPYSRITIGQTLSRSFYGGRDKRVYVNSPDHGIPFLGGSTMLKADLSGVKLISKKKTPNIENTILDSGWILVSRSGTIGKCVFSCGIHKGFAASEHVIRLVPNNTMPSGVIYSFLASRFGYALMTQGMFGSVIQEVEPEYIESIEIPVFPEEMQKKVHELIIESAELWSEADYLLKTAKGKVSAYIGADSTKRNLAGVTQWSQINSSLQVRLDAPYYINRGTSFIKNAKREMKKLEDCNVRIYRPGIFKRNYVENGFCYIKGSELFLRNPFSKCEHLSKTKTPFLDELTLKENQLLFTCAGTCGQVKLITKEYEDYSAIGSQDIIRIESHDELFSYAYLFVYLQLPIINDYIQSLKYGSVIERLEPIHVAALQIITPNMDLVKEINTLISKYKDCIYIEFKNQEKAIRLIEEEIEKWQK